VRNRRTDDYVLIAFSSVLTSQLALRNIKATYKDITPIASLVVDYGVLAVSFVGVYSVHNSGLDLILASLLGLIGYLMRKFEFPLAPVILGLVLGDLLEQSIRQALMISGGEVGILFQSAIAKTLFGLAVFVVVAPKLMQNLRAWNRRGKS
jgi:putative tricarboxylic transport membrane protein